MNIDQIEVLRPSSEVIELLRHFELCGGVLDFAFLNPTSQTDSATIHQAAAYRTLIEVESRIGHWADAKEAEAPEWTGRLFRIAVPSDFSPQGTQIDIGKFLGPRYSNAEGFKRRHASGLYGDEMHGFAYAFMNPPHSLSNADELFLTFKHKVFSDFPEKAEVWQWETEGLNYFDAGREWWGTFYWTYRASPHAPVIGVMGSTTD